MQYAIYQIISFRTTRWLYLARGMFRLHYVNKSYGTVYVVFFSIWATFKSTTYALALSLSDDYLKLKRQNQTRL